MKKWLKRIIYFVLFLFIFLNIVAAFHAYKFTRFYESDKAYTKKPEQMSGWEKTKVILFGVDYVKRPIVDKPSIPYEDVVLRTSDDLDLKAWYAPASNATGTVIMFHGHGGTRSGVLSEMKAFHEFGYNVLAIDFRAHGKSDGNTCTVGYHEDADVMAAYEHIAAKGESNIILWGISMGAAAIARTMAEHENIKPKKVILEMPFATLEEAVEARLRMMKLPEEPFATLLTFWGGLQNGFWAFGHRPVDYVKEINTPVLVQWGRNDSRVSESETTSIFENIPTEEKRLVVYENSGHESLLRKEPAKWVTNVAAFLAPGSK
ncbi:alpha/beta hydrolase [Aridibaculum aurantiacum]|uniref:alpha/beta hydrolase n=1 Tax=Aridibaculum aurantiacum TaxID=2810307 RepID=UPI001A957391|nr:alpha/beta fold hydrolase [Aridibaculum aurantiacum]